MPMAVAWASTVAPVPLHGRNCFTMTLLSRSRALVAAPIMAKSKGFQELLERRRREQNAGPGAVEVELEQLKKDPCPCGEAEDYNGCCGGYHRGDKVEPDALTLLRARFSAYARGVVPYVVKTTHRKNPYFQGEEKLAADVRNTCNRLRFLRLEILSTEQASEDEAFVSFKVTYSRRRGDRKLLLEKSRFVREDGRWLFVEGTPLDSASQAAWIASTS